MTELTPIETVESTEIDKTNTNEETVAPPHLPPRKSHPPVPSKAKVPITPEILHYTSNDSVSLIGMMRQFELYLLPQMVESSDLFTVTSANIDTMNEKISQVNHDELDEDGKFWYEWLVRFPAYIHDRQFETLESHLVRGIPNELRPLVYYKLLQIRYSFHNESFDELLNRAKSTDTTAVDQLGVDSGVKDVLRVFSYYEKEILSDKYDPKDDSTEYDLKGTTSQCFVFSVGKVLGQIPGLQNEQLLFVLLKLNRMFVNLIKGEFFYKVSRSLEDSHPEIFAHIGKQGINMNMVYKKIVYTFFDEGIDLKYLLIILDFVIFEGFDFILRVLVWSLQRNKEKIMELQGNDLNEFLYGENLVTEPIIFEEVLKIEPPIIKYENEFHLIHANSLNNNNNELANLREANEDLLLRIKHLEHDMADLETTHKEILEQGETFKQQLSAAQDENQTLTATRDQLQAKYENLSMKQNLSNTIKANQVFATRNQELQKQIDGLKSEIAKKMSSLQQS
jgi:hypothetical protein